MPELHFIRGGTEPTMLSRATSFLTVRNMLILLAVIVLGYVGYYMYKTYTSKSSSSSYRSNTTALESTGTTSNGKEAELMLFYTDWCPHCKTAKPEWEQVKTQYEGKTINGYQIVFTEVNCTNETPDVEKMVETYKIEGYPTIKLLKDGQVIEFDAKPSAANLNQFLNTVL
uniref:Thioredoxin domain-containing protein n=1 Tax=viral metagenome TaxID=1070528 RepID=A0A6C0B9R0_9ZZZZ